MHSKSYNVEFMIYDNADEVIETLFESLSRYQIGLEVSMRDIDFIFDSLYLLHFKCRKLNFKRGGSYIDYLNWIKRKKAIINPIKKNDNKYF